MVTYERDILGRGHPVVANCQRRSRSIYRYPNGSEIVVGGMDKPERVLSSEYDLVYVQEATEVTEEDWETLTTRLRNRVAPIQQIIACCVPDRPSHWLKRRSESGRALMLESRHEDNPRLHDGTDWTEEGKRYLAVLESLTGARLARLRYGRWVQAEGVVYEEWDPSIHLIDRFDVPSDWRRFRVVDFGYTNPFVCQWWAVDPDDRLYMYRELYMTGRTVPVHADQILSLSQGERITTTICDHDAENRAELEEAGIPTVAARKDVMLGISRVKDRLRIAGDGKPRLYIMRGSLVETDRKLLEVHKPHSTEQEFDSYVWQSTASKEAPLKQDDHGMDCMRYMVMHLDAPGRGETAPLVVPVGVLGRSLWR